MKDLQKDSLSVELENNSNNIINPANTNDITIDVNWDELPDTPYGTIGNIPFHDTTGKIDVNGGGQLQYTLPIALPPGIKSVAPQINLMYTSSSGNGIAGYGWNISGITSISRMGKTIEKDGEVKGVQLDYSDFYQFGGQRLILKSGEYGKDGAEYVTEKYSNVKIKSIGVNETQTGPSRFEVTFEDGSQAWYGQAAPASDNSARTPIEYNIVKWKDAQGNYISYNYIQYNNVACIYRIEWGGNETTGTAHFNSIAFNYITRDTKEVSYINGQQFVQNYILTSIEVNTNNTLFKKYSIEYKKDDKGNNYQFVKSITESNSKGETANPVTFTYQESKSGGWKVAWISNDTDIDILRGDFDGDGKIDMLKYLEAFEECTAGYDEVYHEGDPSNPSNEYGYYEQLCKAQPERREAGLYLFSSVFDDNKPKPVHTGSLGITKEQLKKAKAVNLKTLDGEILPRQGFMTYKALYPQGFGEKKDLELKTYSIDPKSKQLKQEFIKVVPGTVYDNSIPKPDFKPGKNQYWVETYIEDGVEEIDLDGDGLSDLIFTLRDTHFWLEYLSGPSSVPTERSQTRYRYLIVQLSETDPSKLASSLSIGPYYEENFFKKSKRGDFNGDGIVDFLYFDAGGGPHLAIFKKNASGVFSVQNISYSNIVIEGLRDNAVIGDFTGDGKTDLMVPQEEGKEFWKLYISTGKGFKVQNIYNLARFNKSFEFTTGREHVRYIDRQYFAQDLNKDGKADFIEFYSHVIKYVGKTAQTKFIILYHENKGTDASGNVIFETKNIDEHWQKKVKSIVPYKQDWYPEQYGIIENNQSYDIYTEVQGYAFSNQEAHYSPVLGEFRVNNSNEDILVFQKGKLIKYSHDKVSDESRITAIAQGGITTNIDYKELDPNINPEFYKGDNVDQYKYPYVEMDKVSGSYAVSQLRQEGRKQDFKYRGFIAHFLGKGMIGFRQTARSSWYANGYENTKVWSGAEIDPLKEGLPVKEWSVRTVNDNDLIFPQDLSVNNTQLLSFKSTEYDITTPSAGVKVIVPKKTITKDFLKDIIEESTVIYGDYYLPKETTTKVNNDFGVSTTVMSYTHNPNGIGENYFIGRPQSKTETVTAYGDTKSAKEEYTYENNLVKNLKTYNRDNSGWIQESYLYDNFGNITEKTISNSVDTMVQNQKSMYDSKGRFVVKKTDNLGLETTIEYNNWGQIKLQTDPLGNILTNTYDGWGKPETSKTNLDGMTTYTYEKLFNRDSKVTEYSPDGNSKQTTVNKLGQQIQVKTNAYNGRGTNPSSGTPYYVFVNTEYDILGRKIKETEPYYESFPVKWNTIGYDDSVFPAIITATAFNGKAMRTAISGRTTSVEELNGYKRITKKTTDALGNVISSEDKGGVINFSYNAAGEQIKAQYGSNVVTTGYDVWGRKSEFHDPSNGLYKYEYSGFGQIKKEISPNGYKEYSYNPKGQLTNRIEKSNTAGLTDKSTNFSYNDKGLLTSKSGTSNGKNYSNTITYDAYGRVTGNTETSNGRTYSEKNIVFDNQSRVVSYEKSLSSNGISTKTQIENIYNVWNGQLFQVNDKTTGKVLWMLDQLTAKGQVVEATLGECRFDSDYDENDSLLYLRHRSPGGRILEMDYVFDPLKNELKERTRQGNFALSEVFTYDDNNRLVQWTNPTTGGISSNKYDLQGRITENDQVGVIQFGDTAKVYQPTGAKLNTIGKQNYLNAKIQRIIYNENNDPLYIQSKKGDVRFEYGLSNMRQMVTYGQAAPASNNGGIADFATSNWEGAFTKFYSEDGSFEVVRNNTTGEEKHILYIGGTSYESNIVYLKDFTQSSGSYKFLHKDYLGSILAISDEQGNLVQETHFDAWGRLTAGSIGLLGRGYTSHEHFEEIGIIHMNGRLYDPLLRRFLNADENIQDPNNTQNYNKYGYVLNNPLMYNDPSGEFFFLPFLIGVGLGQFFAGVLSAIIVGVAIGAAMYAIQAAISGNWSWAAFGKAILIGAITTVATAGLGNVFSTSGFWAAVGNGALAGGLSGGITSIVNGTNFLQGVLTGAVVGGAIGGITYTINYLVKYSGMENEYRYADAYEANNAKVNTTSLEYSNETLQEMRRNNFSPEEMGKFGVASDSINSVYKQNANGFFEIPYKDYNGNVAISYAYAHTTRPNFFTLKSNIYYARAAFASKELLFTTMLHETAHAYLMTGGNFVNNFLHDKSLFKNSFGTNVSPVNTIGHAAIYDLENKISMLNNFSGIPGIGLDKLYISTALNNGVSGNNTKPFEMLVKFLTPINRKMK